MILKMYNRLEENYNDISDELIAFKQKANDRKSAVIINTMSGIVIAIGAAFLTTEVIPSIATICAGIVLTIIGMWLAFKKVE